MTAPSGRDVDRQRVYDAEESAFGGTTMTDRLSWAEVTTLSAAVAADPWWIALGIPIPEVDPTRPDARTSRSDGRRIVLSPSGQDAATVSHELAHHLVAHLEWPAPEDAAPHGPRFRAAALRTAMVVGGTTAMHLLDQSWRRWGLTVAEWTWAEPTPRQGRALRGVTALGPARSASSSESAVPRAHRPAI